MSHYSICVLEDKERDLWDSFIDQSENGTVFHKYDWLKSAEQHSKMKLTPLIVKKGEEIVGAFPIFSKKKYGLRLIMSPPPHCAIPYLGPVTKKISINNHDQENLFKDVIVQLTEHLTKKYDYIRIVHTIDVIDMRPYKSLGFTIIPNYTYILPLGRDWHSIYDGFHRKVKRNVKIASENEDLELHRGPEYISAIIDLLISRYNEQDKDFRLTNVYIEMLLNSKIGDQLEISSAIVNKELLAGYITIVDKKKSYAWLGTINKNSKVQGVGEYLHWKKIEELCEKGTLYYDMVGANTPHLCEHKSKYGPELAPYYEVNKASGLGKLVFSLYKLLRNNRVLGI